MDTADALPYLWEAEDDFIDHLKRHHNLRDKSEEYIKELMEKPAEEIYQHLDYDTWCLFEPFAAEQGEDIVYFGYNLGNPEYMNVQQLMEPLLTLEIMQEVDDAAAIAGQRASVYGGTVYN
jgi:hypothetical protein